MHRKGDGRAETNCQQESTDLARVRTGSVYTNEDTWIEERLAAGTISRRSLSYSVRKKHHASRWLQKKKKRWLWDRETSTFIKFLSIVHDVPVFTLQH